MSHDAYNCRVCWGLEPEGDHADDFRRLFVAVDLFLEADAFEHASVVGAALRNLRVACAEARETLANRPCANCLSEPPTDRGRWLGLP